MSFKSRSLKNRSVYYERKLANLLWKYGFAVLRGCASGSGVRKRYVPDIVAIKNGKVLVIEVKYRKKTKTIRFSSEKLRNLFEFAKRANGIVILALKCPGFEWKFLELQYSENDLVIRVDEILKNGLTIERLLSKLFSKNLMEFSK